MRRTFTKAFFREHVLQITFWCAAVAIAAIVCTKLVRAQTPSANAIQIAPDRGAPGLSRWLHALQTRASLVLVTAHPDDEDGGMLTYESRGQGARVNLLTLNRGEGGQNVMGPDLYDALGLVRTQELLSADRYMGVDQYFTRAVDFGFSKTREEALSEWGHDRVLSDVVRVIRMTRPLVIASVFVGARHRRPRPASGGRSDGAGSVSGGGRSEPFSGADQRRSAPLVAAQGLRARAQLRHNEGRHVRLRDR